MSGIAPTRLSARPRNSPVMALRAVGEERLQGDRHGLAVDEALGTGDEQGEARVSRNCHVNWPQVNTT